MFASRPVSFLAAVACVLLCSFDVLAQTASVVGTVKDSSGAVLPGGEAELAAGIAIGERLRSIRRQKRLSLQDVEALSAQEFKASVLGAYERGERVISVPRLMRLASIYGVPTEQLLPKEVEVDLTEPGAMDLSEGFAVDLNRLQECREPEALALARLVAMIQAERQDFNGRMLTIRRDDLRAILLDGTPGEPWGIDVQGVLGYPFFRGMRVVFDYERMLLALED